MVVQVTVRKTGADACSLFKAGEQHVPSFDVAQLSVGDAITHSKRGNGVVKVVNKDDKHGKPLHVQFENGETHRYSVASSKKLKKVGISDHDIEGELEIQVQLQPAATGIAETVKQGAAGIAKAVKGGATSIAEKAKQGAAGIAETVKQGATGIAETAKQGAAGIAETAKQGAAGIAKTVKPDTANQTYNLTSDDGKSVSHDASPIDSSQNIGLVSLTSPAESNSTPGGLATTAQTNHSRLRALLRTSLDAPRLQMSSGASRKEHQSIICPRSVNEGQHGMDGTTLQQDLDANSGSTHWLQEESTHTWLLRLAVKRATGLLMAY